MEFSVKVEGIERLASKSKIVARIANQELKKALFASGLMVEKEAKESITQGEKTGRIYQRGNVSHQASAPGEAPASDTGRLVNSVNVRAVDGEFAVEVVAGGGLVNYARDLELGTFKMAARPYMIPASEKSKPAIRRRMKKAKENIVARSGR